MIPHLKSEKLKSQWFIADTLSCKAEIRFYDPLSDWQCFIFAQNPDNENDIMCIISGGKNLEPVVDFWSLYELGQMFNADGEGVQIDLEYRPRQAVEILKRLEDNNGFTRD